MNSGSGLISYEGDPGPVGEYLLTSHSGDLDVSIPASAWVDIKARSIKGQADPDFPIANGFLGCPHWESFAETRDDHRFPL